MAVSLERQFGMMLGNIMEEECPCQWDDAGPQKICGEHSLQWSWLVITELY